MKKTSLYKVFGFTRTIFFLKNDYLHAVNNLIALK